MYRAFTFSKYVLVTCCIHGNYRAEANNLSYPSYLRNVTGTFMLSMLIQPKNIEEKTKVFF